MFSPKKSKPNHTSPQLSKEPFFQRKPLSETSTETIQREEGGSNFGVRIPALEILGMRHGGAFSSNRVPLNSSETALARPIFGSSINYDVVRIVETPIINAPTTLGNNIRIAPNSSMSNQTLIHELAHIWQYQTKGNAYISDSAFHQVAAILATGDRNAAYSYNIVPGQSIHSYTAEQQAMIVEHYFVNANREREDEDYQRMISEVQSSTPSLTDLDRYEESLYGPRNMNQDILDSMPNGLENSGLPPLNIPGNIVRIEF